MLLKKLLTYRLTEPVGEEQVLEALEFRTERKPAGTEKEAAGFGEPIIAAGFMLLPVVTNARIIPAASVKAAAKEKAKAIEAKEGRKVYRKELKQLEDEYVIDKLPHAFIKRTVVHLAFDFREGLMFVDAFGGKADAALEFLRRAMDGLPAKLAYPKLPVSQSLQHWVSYGAGRHAIQLGGGCSLEDKDGGKVSCKGLDLDSAEVQAHIEAGMSVVSLDLIRGDLAFTLDTKMQIKGLKFDDTVQECIRVDSGDDADQLAQAELVMQMTALREFIPALMTAMGGEEGKQ